MTPKSESTLNIKMCYKQDGFTTGGDMLENCHPKPVLRLINLKSCINATISKQNTSPGLNLGMIYHFCLFSPDRQ